VPGLERIVPKSKGAEVGSQLHQLGVELFRSPYGPTIRKILLEIEPDAKDQLPKRSKPAEEASTEAAKPAPVAPPASAPAKAAEASFKKTSKKAVEEPAKAQAAKKPVKKVIKKKVKTSSGAVAKKKPTATKRLTKRKPR
jgi:hypothetical protein